jgi:hypothetical protein
MNKEPNIGPSVRVAASQYVRCRAFDNDLVMVDLQGGEYFALDEIGARMWQLLTAGSTPAEVSATLASEYDAAQDKILGDCTKLADELLKRGLLVLRSK